LTLTTIAIAILVLGAAQENAYADTNAKMLTLTATEATLDANATIVGTDSTTNANLNSTTARTDLGTSTANAATNASAMAMANNTTANAANFITNSASNKAKPGDVYVAGTRTMAVANSANFHYDANTGRMKDNGAKTAPLAFAVIRGNVHGAPANLIA
jgi:hypothetical protein